MRTVFILFAILVLIAIAISAPTNFPTNVPIIIERGLSDMEVARKFEAESVIRSHILFYLGAKVEGVAHKLKAGRYVFSTSTNLVGVLNRVAKGEYGTHTRKITVPEGLNNIQISKLLGVDLGEDDQGYLFPDTYFIDTFATSSEIRDIMIANFDDKVGSVATDTVILASILEEEVRSREDMEIVAGILLKRLDAGMALQVDSYPDSYKQRGLPPKPISNPGLVAIESARSPKKSKYWYYLSGKDGQTHYATTFEEHKKNVAKYLR